MNAEVTLVTRLFHQFADCLFMDGCQYLGMRRCLSMFRPSPTGNPGAWMVVSSVLHFQRAMDELIARRKREQVCWLDSKAFFETAKSTIVWRERHELAQLLQDCSEEKSSWDSFERLLAIVDVARPIDVVVGNMLVCDHDNSGWYMHGFALGDKNMPNPLRDDVTRVDVAAGKHVCEDPCRKFREAAESGKDVYATAVYHYMKLLEKSHPCSEPPLDMMRARVVSWREKTCATCGKTATQCCSKCKAMRYCSQHCQAVDWHVHKIICSTMQMFLATAIYTIHHLTPES